MFVVSCDIFLAIDIFHLWMSYETCLCCITFRSYIQTLKMRVASLVLGLLQVVLML